MNRLEAALPLAHVIAKYRYDTRAEEEQSRREESGFGGGGDIPEWSDFTDAERLSMAKQNTGLAMTIQREGWVRHPSTLS